MADEVACTSAASDVGYSTDSRRLPPLAFGDDGTTATFPAASISLISKETFFANVDLLTASVEMFTVASLSETVGVVTNVDHFSI